MTGLSSSDEFHLVVTTLYSPSAFSHVLSSLRCVVFPEPSGPSKATSSPRRFEGSPKWSRIWRSQDRFDWAEPIGHADITVPAAEL